MAIVRARRSQGAAASALPAWDALALAGRPRTGLARLDLAMWLGGLPWPQGETAARAAVGAAAPAAW